MYFRWRVVGRPRLIVLRHFGCVLIHFFMYHVTLFLRFHIFSLQLEASIKNGDLQGFKFFNEAAKHISSMTKKRDYLDGHQGASKKVLTT